MKLIIIICLGGGCEGVARRKRPVEDGIGEGKKKRKSIRRRKEEKKKGKISDDFV